MTGSLPRRAVGAAWVFILCRQAGVRLACLLFCVGLALGAEPAAPSNVSLRWLSDTPAPGWAAVEVTGLSASELSKLQSFAPDSGRWTEVLAVHAESDASASAANGDATLPPMIGRYRIDGTALRFEPAFPLAIGIVYRAVFRPETLQAAGTPPAIPLAAAYQLPARRATESTVVSAVYPSAGELPENLLKFYLHFSAPMSRGHSYQHIHLLDEAGKEVELPFLELDQELWDPAMTRLTLLLDPGRIKRGVRPLEEIGSSLQPGHRYTLAIDHAWTDAAGEPLRADYRKSFSVSAAERTPPAPSEWRVTAPSAGGRGPLVVTFPHPMDRALALRLIRVAAPDGRDLDGTVELGDQERRWSFTPSSPWPAGPHALVIATTIEDLAGNNIGKAFDVDVFEDVQRSLTSETVRLPFAVK